MLSFISPACASALWRGTGSHRMSPSGSLPANVVVPACACTAVSNLRGRLQRVLRCCLDHRETALNACGNTGRVRRQRDHRAP